MHLVHYKQNYSNFENAGKEKDGIAVVAILLNVSYYYIKKLNIFKVRKIVKY
jgi:hypothetical protein